MADAQLPEIVSGQTTDSPVQEEQWQRALVSEVLEKLKQVHKKKKGKPIHILMTGRTGAGKSTLVNGLVGKEVTKQGNELNAGTTEVHSCEFTQNGTEFVVFDSPGLQDANFDDMDTLKRIRTELVTNCGEIDLVLYCLDMRHTRIDASDVTAINHLTKGFSAELWKRAVFVLTFANSPPLDSYEGSDKDYLIEELEKYETRIKELIPAESIPLVPAGYWRKTKRLADPWKLPDREDWFNVLWLTCLSRMDQNAALSFLLSQSDRIKPASEKLPGEDSEIHSRPIYVEKSFAQKTLKAASVAGAAAGGAATAGGIITACAASGSVAGPVGTAVGGLVGLGVSIMVYFNT